MRVALVEAPEGFWEMLGELPEGVEVSMCGGDTLPHGRVSASGGFDILHLFTNSREGLFRGLDEGRRAIKQDGAIWVS